VARSTRSPARLIVALSVAGVLAVFLVYTALAGTSTPQVAPSQLAHQTPGKISVVGAVVGPLVGDAHAQGGLRFGLHDIGTKTPVVQVVYRGDSPPPLFASAATSSSTARSSTAAYLATASSRSARRSTRRRRRPR
jgi:hypothetical protein